MSIVHTDPNSKRGELQTKAKYSEAYQNFPHCINKKNQKYHLTFIRAPLYMLIVYNL